MYTDLTFAYSILHVTSSNSTSISDLELLIVDEHVSFVNKSFL